MAKKVAFEWRGIRNPYEDAFLLLDMGTSMEYDMNATMTDTPEQFPLECDVDFTPIASSSASLSCGCNDGNSNTSCDCSMSVSARARRAKRVVPKTSGARALRSVTKSKSNTNPAPHDDVGANASAGMSHQDPSHVPTSLTSSSQLKRSHATMEATNTSMESNDTDEWQMTLKPVTSLKRGDTMPNGELCDDFAYAQIKKRRRFEEHLSTKLLLEYTTKMVDLVADKSHLFAYPRGEAGFRLDSFYLFGYAQALHQSLVVMHAFYHMLDFLIHRNKEAQSFRTLLERITIDCHRPELSTDLDTIVLRFHDVATFLSESLRPGRFSTDQYTLHALLALDTFSTQLYSIDVLYLNNQHGPFLYKNRL